MNYGSLPNCRHANMHFYIPASREPELSHHLHDETASLLHPLRKKVRQSRTRESLCNWKVLVLAVLFICGTVIGTYLIISDTNRLTPNFPYYLIELKDWYQNPVDIKVHVPKLALPVTNLIISHVKSDDCFKISSCSNLIRSMINDDLFDIPFNFMISSRGETYEIRGWKYESGITNNLLRNQSVAIALIGTLYENQLAEIESFIVESIKRNQLSEYFKIYGIKNESQQLYDVLKGKSEWRGIL